MPSTTKFSPAATTASLILMPGRIRQWYPSGLKARPLLPVEPPTRRSTVNKRQPGWVAPPPRSIQERDVAHRGGLVLGVHQHAVPFPEIDRLVVWVADA